MNRQRESRGGRVVAATGTGRLSPSQQPRGLLARLRFRFRPPPVVAGLVRNGLVVSLGLICAAVLLLAAAPKKSVKPNPHSQPARLYVHLDRATHVPDGVWRKVVMTPVQKQQLRTLEARFQSEQRQTLHRIGPKAEVLRRQLQIAATTPGQETRAAKLRQEIVRLTLPLQEQRATFVKRARGLLTPQQQRVLETGSAEIKAGQAARRGTGGIPGGAR